MNFDVWQIINSAITPILAGIVSYILFQIKRNARLIEESNKKEHMYIENMCKEKFAELVKRCDSLDTTIRHLHDKWETFLRDYLKIESTRGNKIDALFRVVDNLSEATKQMRNDMREISEVQNSVRELQLKIVKIETIMNGGTRYERGKPI